MFTRIITLLAMLGTLSACIATPRIELVENIEFNFTQPDQTPMSYGDLLCCYDCHA